MNVNPLKHSNGTIKLSSQDVKVESPYTHSHCTTVYAKRAVEWHTAYDDDEFHQGMMSQSASYFFRLSILQHKQVPSYIACPSHPHLTCEVLLAINNMSQRGVSNLRTYIQHTLYVQPPLIPLPTPPPFSHQPPFIYPRNPH